MRLIFNFQKIFYLIFLILIVSIFSSTFVISNEQLNDFSPDLGDDFSNLLQGSIDLLTTSVVWQGTTFPIWIILSFWLFSILLIYIVLSKAPFFNEIEGMKPKKVKLALSIAVSIGLSFGTDLIGYWYMMLSIIGVWGGLLFLIISIYFIFVLFGSGMAHTRDKRKEYMAFSNDPDDPDDPNGPPNSFSYSDDDGSSGSNGSSNPNNPNSPNNSNTPNNPKNCKKIEKLLSKYLQQAENFKSPLDFIKKANSLLDSIQQLYKNNYNPKNCNHTHILKSINELFLKYLNEWEKNFYYFLKDVVQKIEELYSYGLEKDNSLKSENKWFMGLRQYLKMLLRQVNDLQSDFNSLNASLNKSIKLQKRKTKIVTKSVNNLSKKLNSYYNKYENPHLYEKKYKKLLSYLNNNNYDKNTSNEEKNSSINREQLNNLIDYGKNLNSLIRDTVKKLPAKKEIENSSKKYNKTLNDLNNHSDKIEKLVESVDSTSKKIGHNNDSSFKSNLISELKEIKKVFNETTKLIHKSNKEIDIYIRKINEFINIFHNFNMGRIKRYLSSLKNNTSVLDSNPELEELIEVYLKNRKLIKKNISQINKIKDNLKQNNTNLMADLNRIIALSKDLRRDIVKIVKSPGNYNINEIKSKLNEFQTYLKKSNHLRKKLFSKNKKYFNIKEEINNIITNQFKIINYLNKHFEHKTLNKLTKLKNDWKDKY